MKIKEYPKATSLAEGDVFIIDNDENGTRHISQEDLPWGKGGGGGSVPETDPAVVAHKNTYRGNSLGNIVTEEQIAKVRDGSFDDFYIGDYWTINGYDWAIADMNYYRFNQIVDETNKNHLLMIPSTYLQKTAMETAQWATTKGYAGSNFRTNKLPSITNTIKSAFPNLLKKFKISLVNDNKNNYISVETECELMNVHMFFGANAMSRTVLTESSMTQLKLFELNKTFFKENFKIGTRDLHYAYSDSTGNMYSTVNVGSLAIGYTETNEEVAIVPYFLIG